MQRMVKPWQRYAFSECLLVAVMITFSLKWSIVVLVLLGISECHNWQVLIIAKTLNELKWITAIFCDWLIHSFIYWKNTSSIWLPEKRGQQLISLEPLISCCCSAFLWTCMWIFHPINLFFFFNVYDQINVCNETTPRGLLYCSHVKYSINHRSPLWQQ